MRHVPHLRFALLLWPALTLVGCGPPGPSHATLDLGDREQAGLAPAIASGEAGVQRLPDGARITLSDQVLFPPGSAVLTDHGRVLLTNLIEGLVAPPRLVIDVTDAAGVPASLLQARTIAVTQFLQDYELGPDLYYAALQPTPPTGPNGAASSSVAVTVTVIPRSSG